MRPLAEQSVGLESLARRLEELAREQRRHTCHPRIGRFRDDHVIATSGQEQVRTSVPDHESDRRRSQHVPVFTAEETRRLHDFRRRSNDDNERESSAKVQGPPPAPAPVRTRRRPRPLPFVTQKNPPPLLTSRTSFKNCPAARRRGAPAPPRRYAAAEADHEQFLWI